MKKVLIGALAIGALVAGAVHPVAAKPKPKPKPPVVVFEDAAGDAGNQDSSVPGAAEAGFDLVKGEISKEGTDSLKFVVTHSAMPATGTPGEAFRFIWGLGVDGTQYEMTVKSLDVGKPDVIASAMAQDPKGEERVGQVYQGVARFEECGTIATGINWAMCESLGYYEAAFDPATKTVTWVVPLEIMGGKKGTIITGGTVRTGCSICWVPQEAERSLTPQSLIDSATQTVAYKVP